MYKSRLQELCQRKKWALPSYTSMKDGPDHIPQFKASVVVNGLSFDSPASCKSFKDAHNHAAMLAFLHFTSPSGCSTRNVEVPNKEETNQGAEIQSNAMSYINDFVTEYANRSKNPMEAEHSAAAMAGLMSGSLDSFQKDESGIYKNLLQELTKRECLRMPIYRTTKSVSHHTPTFFSSVEVERSMFYGIAGKSEKQAEHSAAMIAYKSLKEGGFTQAGNAKTVAEAYQGVGVIPSDVMYGVKNTQPTLSNGPVQLNRRSQGSQPSSLRRTLGRDSQNLLEYFKKMQSENLGFFYAIQLDEDNRMTNVFWADLRSRTAYGHFGDLVTLDTTYRVNQYKVLFVPFTGVNHHGQTILFGCALLLDESEASFIWLFKTFLMAMNDQPPVSIVTEQDKAIQTAVAHVFPQARHCISKWHVLREGQEKLAHVCLAHPHFHVELLNCINLTETIEEFESSWNSVLDKYDLRRNDWLQSLYNARAQWVPVYFRDSFFAAISPNLGCDGFFFDGYVNQQTTLPMFFRQYERALEKWSEKEIEADFDTIWTMPVLRTPSPMEKQAADVYTRKIFAKFQEELVESFVYTANRIEGDGAISIFRVAKFKDDNKAYIVTKNNPEMRANCSCQMFEYSGILCRHVLTVLTVTNVLTLPSHYILKRWTRNAKSGPGTDEYSGDLHGPESFALRYNNLCGEAIRYAEEGATAVETYHAALSAFRDGGKKVALVKKNVAKVAPPSFQVSGTSYDDRKISASASDAMPLHRDEVLRRFDLNDAGAPAQSVADLNLPHMAPVSLHRDDGSPENMVALPFLKSMTWVMEYKNSTPGNRIALMKLKLQDDTRTPSAESEVKFHLSRVLLKQMLRSMAKKLSTPANKVAVINLKLQDRETTSGVSEIKFQVSRETLGTMLISMAHIREQLSNAGENQPEPLPKKQRK